jgi:hypothetical protein
MARLLSSHDPYHIHAILGLFSLLHYLYRYGLLALTGDAFPPSEPRLRASMGVALHGVLSVSSLMLPLPKNRNMNAPMIWRESRLHSIIFSLRHVFTTLITINKMWPTGKLTGVTARLAALLVPVACASEVTRRMGSREQRSTNSMSYPKGVSDVHVARIKFRYASNQFGASVAAVLPDATINWSPLLAIQIAAFLMTLVRKSKASAATYHRVYALSLWINFAVVAARVYTSPDKLDPPWVLFAFLMMPNRLRISLRAPTWLCWTWHLGVVYLAYPAVASAITLPSALPQPSDYYHLAPIMFVPVALANARDYAALFFIQRADEAPPHNDQNEQNEPFDIQTTPSTTKFL